ncbi:hypothetical protein ACM6Q4_18250 [Bacillus pumilus]|uniref:hypothetical protein n=1 Tax=Bacillus pumilus TaxID=1408 RepID=UPI0039FCF7F7
MNSNDKPIQKSLYLETQKNILSLLKEQIFLPRFGSNQDIVSVVEELHMVASQLEEYVEYLQSTKEGGSL